MINRTDAEIYKFFEELGFSNTVVDAYDDYADIEIRDYSPVEVDVEDAFKIVRFFGTANIVVDRDEDWGCPCCDTGPSYIMTLTMEPECAS